MDRPVTPMDTQLPVDTQQFGETHQFGDTLLPDETPPDLHASATARLLHYSPEHYAALPPHATMEVVEKPRVVPVPGAPYYAHGLMQWQDRWLPLIHLDSLIRGYVYATLPPVPRYCLVVAYQTAPGEPIEHGAIALPELPQFVTVTDADACPLPDDSDLWSVMALSCFSWGGKPVPILDTGRLFGEYHG